MDNDDEKVYLKPGNIIGLYVKLNFMEKGQIYRHTHTHTHTHTLSDGTRSSVTISPLQRVARG